MPKRVSIVVFRECDPSIVYGVFDTLWAAGTFYKNPPGEPPAEPLFEPRIVAAEPGPLELITGVSIVPQDSIDDIGHTDIVFVPNVIVLTSEELHALDRRLIDWIARMHRQGALICSACGGSLVLAAAGLLSGRETTTHWSHVPVFRREFPDVRLHEDRILVQTGDGHRIIACGGASSWQDLALLLVARYGSGEEAIRMSRFFLYQWHRDGQLPYASMAVNVVHGDAVILKCQSWLGDNYAHADVIAEVARVSGLPKRTFDRRFRAATGYSPLAYVQALRIEEAKQMLETDAAPVDAIGREVGYEDAASFRRLFRRLTGLAPGDYRRRFRIPEFVRVAAAAPPAL
ncbi:GlxA family transcriptional regulator [Devosia nitrariae]|uniref:AraC family transcriptional regulator n=1 Tax=Devosia nitrariae TaxID=2071872 RepID=A0ABQ5VYL3_9HYPH|nr:helix-turn-helix domain-containing protein [Devosia nitrariae]GLQ52884.1 AraC family transcriptional regulator [Devosia nitrariae]